MLDITLIICYTQDDDDDSMRVLRSTEGEWFSDY